MVDSEALAQLDKDALWLAKVPVAGADAQLEADGVAGRVGVAVGEKEAAAEAAALELGDGGSLMVPPALCERALLALADGEASGLWVRA